MPDCDDLGLASCSRPAPLCHYTWLHQPLWRWMWESRSCVHTCPACLPTLGLSVPRTGSCMVSLPTLGLSVPCTSSCFFPPTDSTAHLMWLRLGYPKFLRLKTPIQTQNPVCTPNLVPTTSHLLLSSGSWRSFESLLFDPRLIPQSVTKIR